ncbi:hypothetical protein OCGS_2654 [Oceaniovalibus guishaninsula JLT2003]|uniref:HTH tetR-type domain-containing protein n=1 Tax=Oceaniovalibus guishaninsula JLT2003 TaxID=1231392 RepID=K2H643_9RHOB|nr:TetR/AcrR family transcriptional regulator [Oceaniovalibus guishaninsula]EKE43063.1 hypothetical protein OCGS_2654 [Oceaniovalibus guishaninsula JLT2003]
MNVAVPDPWPDPWPDPRPDPRAARKSARREAKRAELAASALETLKSLGYARTSLRDIAAASGMSLGSLHYYFADKSDLIVLVVRRYKRDFTAALEAALAPATGREAVIAAFARALARSIVAEAETHRLWYDIRGQAMFDTAFRPAVEEIEATLIDAVAFAARRMGQGPDAPEASYAMIDGLFRQAMDRQLTGPRRDADTLTGLFAGALARIFPPPGADLQREEGK